MFLALMLNLSVMKTGYIFTIIVFAIFLSGINANADIYADKQQCLQQYYMKSYTHALPFCIRSAKEGNNQSQYVLGLMYSDGLGAKRNKVEAIKWLRAAAKQAHAAAHYKLEKLENESVGSSDMANIYQDKFNRGKSNLKKLKRHKRNHAKPFRSVTQPPNTVDVSIEKHPSSAHLKMHKSPPQSSPPPDNKVLYQQYLSSAQGGDAHARFMLGLFYLEGRGIQQDSAQAGKWIKQAAMQNLPRAQFTMGLLYMQGYAGAAPNIEKATFWLARAANQGLPEAQYSMGLMLARGANGKKNEPEAIKWWHKAATQGYAKAQHNLAVIYLKGIATTVNRSKAMRWFASEAEQGDPQTQFNMGRLYSEGKWLKQSGEDAITWFYRAGETWLAMKQPKKASQAVEKIRQLGSVQHVDAANLFLAEVLTRKIKEAGLQQAAQ